MRVEYLENKDLAIFNGLKFRRDKKTGYYLNSNIHKRLHVYVWEYFNGKVADGYQVHHKKEKQNNDIEFLESLSQKEHMKIHGETETEERKEWKRNNLKENVRPKASEWHKSKEGREWHKKHFEQFKDKMFIKHIKICDYCKMKYETTQDNSRFCSNKCSSAWRRKEGLDNEKRICIYCGKEFEINKYAKTETCSRSCASKIAYQNRSKE